MYNDYLMFNKEFCSVLRDSRLCRDERQRGEGLKDTHIRK